MRNAKRCQKESQSQTRNVTSIHPCQNVIVLIERRVNKSHSDGRIGFGERVIHDGQECLKKRQLEHHGRHFAIKGDPVQHFDDAVVRQRRIGCVASQQMAKALHNVFVRKPVNRWRKNSKI